MANLIEFSDEDFEMILEFQKQEGWETVQEAVRMAISACLAD